MCVTKLWIIVYVSKDASLYQKWKEHARKKNKYVLRKNKSAWRTQNNFSVMNLSSMEYHKLFKQVIKYAKFQGT